MRRYRETGIAVLLVLLTLGLQGADFKKAGTTGFGFLEIPVTARQMALGDAMVACRDRSSDAVFTNPAGLAYLGSRHCLSVSYGNWLIDMQHSSFSYGVQLGNVGNLGISAVVLDMGEMQRTVLDASAPGGFRDDGQFGADALSLGLSYARMMTDRFAFGGNLKYVREQIDGYQAENVLLDIGTIYYTGFSSLRLATNIQNFGLEGKFIGDDFKMPTTFYVGLAMELIGEPDSPQRLTVSVAAVHPSNYTERVNISCEYVLGGMLSLRGGYKFNYDEQSWTGGLGLDTDIHEMPLGVSVGYNDYRRLGSVLKFTFYVGI